MSAFGATHVLTVYDSSAFRCVNGVNQGDALRDMHDLCLGDLYRLDFSADALQIDLIGHTAALPMGTAPRYALHGDPATEVHVGPRLIMMTTAGRLTEMRSLHINAHIYLLPLGRVDLFAPHTIIDMTEDAAPLPVADPTVLAFTRGTRLTTSDGRLVPIEALQQTDALLTRDGRAAPLRALLSETVPALGRATRIVIREGAFANETELVVAAEHRLYVPARRSDLDPHGPDRMEPAMKLVNGLTVTAETGGSTEYYHVLLDRHEVIYAEGIPCESFLLNATTRAGLSQTVAEQVRAAGEIAPHVTHPARLPLAERPIAKPPAKALKPAEAGAQAPRQGPPNSPA